MHVEQHQHVEYDVVENGRTKETSGIVQDVTIEGTVFVSRSGPIQRLDILEAHYGGLKHVRTRP